MYYLLKGLSPCATKSMASCMTPKNHPQNPETKTPKNPMQNTAETRITNTKKSTNMEKLKDTVMELLKAEPNMPLSQPHKAHILDERLTQILSLLRSPDHPPYAWMIERAIQELNEKGGSSEESISKFIKKAYDDLPWAHGTMLKHHLVQLCASGEVILTRDERYLLAGGDSDGKISTKCKKKSARRKCRAWDWEKKRSNRRGKVNRKENIVPNENVPFDDNKFLLSQRKDQLTSKEVVETEEHGVEGVEQQNLKGDEDELLLSQPKAQGTSNELHEEEDWMIQGIEQQNLADEFSKGTEILCVAEEKVVDSNSDALPIVAPSIPEGKNKSENSSMQQKRSEPTAGLTDVFSRTAQLKLGGINLEDNQMEVSSPERPPGFEPVTLEEVSHVHPLTAVSSELPIRPEQLSQLDEHDILDDGKASASGLCVIEESIPTDRMERQMKRWRKRLSGVKAPLISDILLSRESQNSELSGQEKIHIKPRTPVESTMVTDVKGKLCSQQQKVLVASSDTLQQPHSKTLSKLPSLDRYPEEPKHHVEPSEHERKKRVAQGTQIRRVLRPRPLKPEPQSSNANY